MTKDAGVGQQILGENSDSTQLRGRRRELGGSN